LLHAIFTRQGGASQKPFASLNLSQTVGDAPQAVQCNFERACQAVQIKPEQTVTCHLIHSADVLTIQPENHHHLPGKADGLITNHPEVYLFMRFGDCAPLLFFDPIHQVVGLTHAGWRGTMQNAAGATVHQMQAQFGCQPENMIAVIGPAIGPCCYEVGPEVIEAAARAFPDPNGLLRAAGYQQNGHAYFDLWEANRRQLISSGLKQIVSTNLCTACRTDQFFSHRAEQGRTGRFGVIIGLRKGK
jgi:hypothetical protein